MKKIKGSALVDYLIPTLIIGAVAGMGIYTIQSSGVLKNFISASLNIDVGADGKGVVGETVATNDTIATIEAPPGLDLSTIKAGDLGGTPEQPVKSCVGNDCAIDFGDVILTGVPENFGAYVETNGNSGGIEAMKAMLIQIANQLDDPETPEDEGAAYRRFANLGHYVASNISSGEEYLKTNKDSINPENILSYYSGLKASFPPELDGVISDPGLSLSGMLIDSAIEGPSNKSLGDIRKLKDSTYSSDKTLYEKYKDSHPLYAMIEEYDKIQNSSDPKITPTMKAITEQIFLDLDRVIYDFQTRNDYYTDSGSFYTKHKSPLTGAETGENLTYSVDGKSDAEIIDEILHPQSSFFTDLDSALICTTGSHDDTGTACK